MTTPAPGTTRYLCPLECGWHHDVPPPSPDDVAGIYPAPGALGLHDAIGSVIGQAAEREGARTEAALRDHLSTHTTEQFVRTVQDLRRELAALRGTTS